MKPRERFLTALAGEQPDEVPISLSIGPTNAQEWLGRSDWHAVYQAHKLVGSIPTYGYSGSPVPTPHWHDGWDETVERQTFHSPQNHTIERRTITTPHGTLTSQERVDYLEYDSGQTLEPLIKTRDDYAIYMAYIKEWARCVTLEESPEVLAQEKEIGDEGVRVWWIIHTFYHYYWVLRRVQDYLLDFVDVPEMMKEVMTVTHKVNERILEAFNQSRCRVLITNISGASTSIVSPAFFREWVLPELKWLVANAAEDKLIGFHSTGKVRDTLPIVMEARPHFLLRFESPRFGGDISLGEAKDLYGDRVCLMGGYDPHIYLEGDMDAVRQEAIRCIDEAAAGGGYVLDNTDAVPPGTRMEVVRAMVETARAHGKY